MTVSDAGIQDSHAQRVLEGVEIGHVGHFDPAYSRNRIVAKALRRAGANVATFTDGRSFVARSPRIARELVVRRPDLVLVGFPGNADVLTARLATAIRGHAPVLLDAFVSLYETNIEDRAEASRRSLRASRYWLEDRVTCRLASRLMVDTHAHADYFAAAVGVPREGLRVVPLGADDEVMRPSAPPRDSEFRVFLYASFIPLHGIEHVVRAAHLLEERGEEVAIDIVGGGQTEQMIRRLVSDLRIRSVRLLGRRRYDDLPALMAACHVCLGIFGTSGKAGRVVPNKVFDALAVARPVITADTPAVREVLTHGKDVWSCPPGDPEALADAILTLRDDDKLREDIAAHGYELFTRRFSLDAVSRELALVVSETLNGRERESRSGVARS